MGHQHSVLRRDGDRRALSLSHALDIVRACRHYVRDGGTGSKEKAAARLDRLIAKVLEEQWPVGKLQEYVGALGRSPKRDPLDRAVKNVDPKAAPETVAGIAAGCATPAADSPAVRPPPLFQAKRIASRCS